MANDYLYETHMHTAESSRCGQDSAAKQVRGYKKRGYSGIIVTDHFINGNSTCPDYLPWEEKMNIAIAGYTAAKKEGNKCGLDVFLGWEFSYHGADFLTYGLDLDFLLAHPNIHKKNPEEYSKIVRKNGGYIAQAHPFRSAYYIADPKPYDPKIIDGIEVFNASEPPENNQKTKQYAKKHKLPMQAGSDSHAVGTKFLSGVIMQERAGSIHDIIDAIKGGDVQLVE